MFDKLRMRRDIINTRTLVQAFNKATDPDERKAFRFWLSTYGEWLNSQRFLIDDENQFIFALFDISCRENEDKVLVKKLFQSLCRHVLIDKESAPNLMKALDYALSKIDISVLEGQWSHLLSLMDALLKKLTRASFTSATYKIYGPTLFALHQIVGFLKKGPNVMTAAKFQDIKTQLKQIEERQEYYPIAYHARLIRIGIKKLNSGGSAFTISPAHRAFYTTLGLLYFADALTAAVHLSLKIDAFEGSINNLQKSCPDFWDSWRDDYLEKRLKVVFEATEITMETNNFSHFKKCYDEIKERMVTAIFRRSLVKMLRFSLITQLQLLASNNISTEIRSNAIDALTTWGMNCAHTKWSSESGHVFQALLESLHSIHKRGEKREQVEDVLRNMTRTTNRRFKAVAEDWLQQKSLGQKLQEQSKLQIESNDDLYNKVRKRIEIPTPNEEDK